MVTMIGSFALMSALTVIPYPQHVVTAKGAFALPMDRVEKSDVSWRRDASIPAEGYRLSVTPNGVTAWSSDDAGAFYALQTLKQMAPEAGIGRIPKGGGEAATNAARRLVHKQGMDVLDRFVKLHFANTKKLWEIE